MENTLKTERIRFAKSLSAEELAARNAAIKADFDSGMYKIGYLARKWGLTRQRIYRICEDTAVAPNKTEAPEVITPSEI